MTQPRFSMAVGLLTLLPIAAASLNAQVPENLAQPMAFRALRLSSTDPRFNNGDSRPIAPGATLELGRIKGHGRIEHMWFTISGQSQDHLRELVLRIFWDGADKPAIECPLGDFFGLGFGRYVEYKSAPIAIGGIKALNCYWPMPFAKGAHLTMTNEGSKPVPSCYFNIDYRLDDQPAADARYFHTQYRQAFPVPKREDYLLLNSTGRGHYVGTFLSVMANSDGWWGEGNDKFYVDGAKKPTIEGTGSEDYFCGAWDFQHAFSNPYSGVPLYDNPEKGGEKRGILNTCYRWHILDPVPFTKSLRVTIEHGSGGPNDDRNPLRNHYASVAFYYLDRAEGDGAPLPPYLQRVPKLLPLPEVSHARAVDRR
ncbi:MAG: glycoside hydrolase family 172 protein [Thermoguttaceae bacterium]